MPYGRVTFSGTLANGVEDWSTGFAFGGVAVVNDPLELFPLLQAGADGIRDGLGGEDGFGTVLQGGIGSLGEVNRVEVSWRDDEGVLIMGATSLFPEPLGGTGTPDNPLSNAIVVTTLSGMPGGRYRGRMFLPAVAHSIGTSGRFDPSVVIGVADGAQALIQGSIAALTTAFDTTAIDPIIWSRARGAGSLMRRISVGDVPDVMRRRRDRLTETRQERDVLSEPIPAP